MIGDDDPTAILQREVSVGPVMSPSCTFSVLRGPDANAQHHIDDLAARRVLIGQGPACDVRLSDRTVSRRHAAIELESGGIHLIDLDSSNGTVVNGVRIRDAFVTSGAVVQLGETTMRLDFDATPHAVASSNETRFGRVLGASPAMRRLYPVLERLAATDVPVLLEGETGTGKEVVAEALHEAHRRTGPFVVLDCTTVTPSLLEAELFGHERGAFTGAERARAGLFEEANGGTLFVDEIGDLDLGLQAKMLRALERHEVRRVGSNTLMKVDVRIIAATRRNLDAEVQARRFRDDLFFRLAVARVELPPLRKREGDIALLTRCFWAMLGGDATAIPPDVIQRFEAYDWPGNVRELHNAVARQLALGAYAIPEPRPEAPAATGDLLDRLVKSGLSLARARQEIVLELERRYVAHVLELHGGNIGRAAEACGIGRRYFQMLRNKL